MRFIGGKKPAVKNTSRSTEAYALARAKKMKERKDAPPSSVTLRGEKADKKDDLQYLARSDPARRDSKRFRKAKKEVLKQQRRSANQVMGAKGERLRSQKA